MKYVLWLLLALPFTSLYAQQKDLPGDTAEVNRMIATVRRIQHTDPQKANELLRDVLKISEALRYKRGLAAYYGLKATSAANRMQLDSAKRYNDKALLYIKDDLSVEGKNQLAIIYNTYGVIYHQKQQYDSATVMYLKVVKLCNETGNHYQNVYAYSNLSVVYAFMNDTLKTERYARLAYSEAKKSGDTLVSLRSTITLLNHFTYYGRYDSVPPYALPALKMAEAKGDLRSKAKILHVMGDYYYQNRKDNPRAYTFFRDALKLFREVNSPYDEAIVLVSLGNISFSENKYPEAIALLKEALAIENNLGLLQLKTETLKSLSAAEARNGNISGAYDLLEEYVVLHDSLSLKTNEEMVQTLETRYQLQNKEDTIALQQSSIRQKNALNYILLGSALALILILFLLYRNYTARQKLQQQRITELETEKQLLATQFLLKGQEDERSRMAKDLHDGLGGMLSGVKLQLGAMKGNLVLTEENGVLFNNALNKLDESISEMRRVAHNMMPEALVRLGLEQALQDYCSNINPSGGLMINTGFYGLDQKMEAATAVTIYRIVQELVNNAVKHSAATEILVQVMRRNRSLNITVEDNGKGFDIAAWQQQNTAGFQNIRSRVDYLRGRMDIKSVPGKGTSVYIECTDYE